MIARVLTVLVVLGLVIAADAGRKLNQYIHHFEPLNYDTAELHTRHQRAKRSPHLHEQFVHLEFHSHGRHFNLRLKRDTSIFSPNFKLETEHGEEDYDTSHIYSGGLYGYPDTVAHGSIIEGRFEGFVHAHHGKYYIEPTERYFDGPQRFHSVIYMDQDIKYPHRYGPYGGCGMDHKLQDWMEAVQNSAVEENKNSSAPHKDEKKETVQQSRKKRALGSTNPEVLQRGSCEMYIQADHKFFEYFQTRDAVIGQISSHIKAINLIYKDVVFADSNSNGITGVTFTVRRVKVNETSGCSDPGGTSCRNPFAPDNIGVERFLEINSEANHDDYCLAYVFTDRDFDDGVLGLAWVGSASGSSGGICENYKKYSDGKYKSLNTGIVTIHNYGSRVPPKVSYITFAHEVGHNFGSPHDTKDCAPGGEDGNFIMYARATSGDKTNNNKFSACSKGSIYRVLDAKIVGSSSTSCFTETNAAICGNGIVEEGEECDCGYQDHCERTGEDNCCVPAGNPNPCKLKPGKQCSPSQGPCCTSTCIPKPTSVRCSKESECSDAANCDGTNPQCPSPQAKGNKTECNNGRQVCWSGICQGSICEKFDLEECTCSLNDAENNRQELCHLCCQVPGNPDTCKSSNSSEWPAARYREMTSRGIINAPPGAPCDNFQGYCDVFFLCRQVDADGPLSRLKNSIFNAETIKTVVEWIRVYWWAVILIILGLILFMAGFIKLCAVHTPSSNPKKPPPRPMSLRRQKHRQQRQRQHAPQDQGHYPPQGHDRRGHHPRGAGNPPPYNPDFVEMQRNPRYSRR
ncbi:PREDICTED: disintegrin and metalloproteinase domain-containing protein 10-like isoform X1 [Branchiostoma belcheri]|uniref:ADAM10 endopeptidase n=1 Tax=Branchiostoma belcheri TaxID=7741 RepID=A0A6P4YLX1_BRABE|nr:PREDICTED: disintegrin and metalloproteinase domain-containing protein 10-like isoform X1 [Branchiostoma belcheri]